MSCAPTFPHRNKKKNTSVKRYYDDNMSNNIVDLEIQIILTFDNLFQVSDLSQTLFISILSKNFYSKKKVT